jgi:serine/threonine protein kinase
VEQINILVDKMGTARIGDFGLMTIGNLGTNLFSESIDLLVGTLSWMSPELMSASRANSKVRATCESDCYALGMVIYEVSWLAPI